MSQANRNKFSRNFDKYAINSPLEMMASVYCVELMKRLLSGEIKSGVMGVPTSICAADLDNLEIPLVYLGGQEYHAGDSALEYIDEGIQITWQKFEHDIKRECRDWALDQPSVNAIVKKAGSLHTARAIRGDKWEDISFEALMIPYLTMIKFRPEVYIDGTEFWVYRRHIETLLETGTFEADLSLEPEDSVRTAVFPDGLPRYPRLMYAPVGAHRRASFRTKNLFNVGFIHTKYSPEKLKEIQGLKNRAV
jgi:hypothetical protein